MDRGAGRQDSLEHLAALRLDLLALDAPALVEGLLTRQEDPAGERRPASGGPRGPGPLRGRRRAAAGVLASELAAAGSYSAEDADALATAVARAARGSARR